MRECGLYYASANRGALPLDGVHVSVRIVDLVAEVQLVMFFVNPEALPVDAEFVFPVDHHAAVCGFEVELATKLLIGEVKERQAARVEYQAAVARGETAALLEKEKDDVFRQRIGNMPPQSRVNIRVTYVTELAVESDGAARFVLPTSVAPRFVPPGVVYYPLQRPWWQVVARRLYFGDYEEWPCCPWPYGGYLRDFNRERQSPCAFSVAVEIECAHDIVGVDSPTHAVKWCFASGETSASASVANRRTAAASLWSDTAPMDKDFVLKVQQAQPNEPRVVVEVAADGSACAMLTMVPDFDLEPQPTEIQFLVDCSGSMQGNRIQAAKRALKVPSARSICCFVC